MQCNAGVFLIIYLIFQVFLISKLQALDVAMSTSAAFQPDLNFYWITHVIKYLIVYCCTEESVSISNKEKTLSYNIN